MKHPVLLCLSGSCRVQERWQDSKVYQGHYSSILSSGTLLLVLALYLCLALLVLFRLASSAANFPISHLSSTRP